MTKIRIDLTKFEHIRDDIIDVIELVKDDNDSFIQYMDNGYIVKTKMVITVVKAVINKILINKVDMTNPDIQNEVDLLKSIID